MLDRDPLYHPHMRRWRCFWLGLAAVAACTQQNPAAVCSDGTCSDPAFPYCDTTGVITGEPNTCVAVSCTPGTVHSCDAEQALTCSESGDGYELRSCQFGCGNDPTPHCR